MSIYPMYNKKVMEAVRQLTLEEMLCALCDLAEWINQDRLRDMGPSREAGFSDDRPLRPLSMGVEPLVHAMQSAGFDMEGWGTYEQIQEELGAGAPDAASLEALRDRVDAIGSIMESEGLPMAEAVAYLDGEEPVPEVQTNPGPWGWA